ncbi:hypothetical protein C8035_v003992 [Colletotrichum spinosum]|uniref:Uncharacterized protein n=1 Tax=Colletotrichum spinosum TaxID=1347390 RepID=A0A4R8PZI9_9PEZI|nr:hypothetical protein C8035_v003992 [Colletotrichum spinosum]
MHSGHMSRSHASRVPEDVSGHRISRRFHYLYENYSTLQYAFVVVSPKPTCPVLHATSTADLQDQYPPEATDLSRKRAEGPLLPQQRQQSRGTWCFHVGVDNTRCECVHGDKRWGWHRIFECSTHGHVAREAGCGHGVLRKAWHPIVKMSCLLLRLKHRQARLRPRPGLLGGFRGRLLTTSRLVACGESSKSPRVTEIHRSLTGARSSVQVRRFTSTALINPLP